MFYGELYSTQPAIICSNLTIEMLQQGVKYVKVKNLKTLWPLFMDGVELPQG